MISKQMTRTERWSSLIAFIWVASGAAVGLGNIWKFPYMAGQSGGSAFVLIYLLCVIFVGIPVMSAEIILGILAKRNPVDGFAFLAERSKRNPNWKFVGALGIVTLQCIFAFYSVVAGWSIAYLGIAASGNLSGRSTAEIVTLWKQFLGMPWVLVGCGLLFVFLTMWIVRAGIKKGIERASEILMPGLLIILVALVVYSCSLGGFSKAFDFLFSFNLEKIDAAVVVSALGHAFFTLAVGACCMMVYGTYLKSSQGIFRAIFVIAGLDTFVALLAGFAIFPLIFAYELSPAQGPGLMFVSLPMVFAQMPFGDLIGALFFLLLFFAALSSSLSFGEPLADMFMDRFSLSRKQSSWAVGIITGLLTIGCALSFNIWSEAKLFNRWTFFDVLADFSTNILLPLGGILIALFAAWFLKKEMIFEAAIFKRAWTYLIWKVVVGIIAPLGVLIVMVHGIMDMM